MPVANMQDNTAQLVANMRDYERIAGEINIEIAAHNDITDHSNALYDALNVIRDKVSRTKAMTLAGIGAKARVAIFAAEFEDEPYLVDPILRSIAQDKGLSA